jgi:zinc protease
VRKTLLVVAGLLAAVAGPARAGAIFPYPSRAEVLPNGLKVILIPMRSEGLLSYFTIVRTGSRDEVEPGKSGFAHFFEHMMFRGTPRVPAEEYERILTTMGASRNAFTTDDFTGYYIHATRGDLETIAELESDRFQNLSYSEEVFRTEAGAVYGEYRKSITSPFLLLYEKLADLAFDVHTYKHTTIGFERDIQAMPEGFEYSLSFFKRFYRPENTILLVVGDLDPEQTLALVRRRYGDWERGYVPPEVPREPPQKKERTGEVIYPGRTLPILHLGYKGEAFDATSRRYAAALLLAELAFGETSDLYKRLYVKEQKVERLSGDVPMSRDPKLFSVQAVVKRESDLEDVKRQIEATIARFQKTPVDATRLRDVKRRWRYLLLMNLDSPARVSMTVARLIALTGGIEVIDQLLGTLDQVTAKDIMEAARTYYVPARRTVVTLRAKAS